MFVCYTKNMKILSPAGNLESLKLAVYNGANEVYLGINQFNARNNIDGFNINTLSEAVNFAHVFGVKVHLAINILFSNTELQTALNTIVDAYNLGVDAFIIQDIGLIKLVHEFYPEIEIHASTQMGIHNLEGVKALEQYNIKRVVLSRETPLNEIKRIKQNSSVEIEYFAQGALCVAFSGNCYLSSYLHNASGNRGRCKQLCRLPYSLLKNGKILKHGYLLSAKDFNTINMLDKLKEAGVDAIKIEGRARRPFYVATATREYYNALHKNKVNHTNLKLGFNREYTQGYFDGNGNIISNYNNHIGINVGKVLKVNNGKKFNEVFISSNQPLTPKSTFKFFDGTHETNTLTAFDLQQVNSNNYKLTTTQKVAVGNLVNLIIDYGLENEVLSYTKKRDVNIKFYAECGKQIEAEFEVNKTKFKVFGDVLQPAQKQPLALTEIKQNFSKSELFNAQVEILKLDSVFIPKQKLNEFRRQVFEKVFEVLTALNKPKLKPVSININYNPISFNNFEFVENLNQKFTKQNVVFDPNEYNLKEVENFIAKCSQQNKTPYLNTPNFALEPDIKLLNQIIEKTKIGIVANNYYALTFNTNIVIGGGLNVYNSVAANIYNAPIICAEGNIGTKQNFAYMTLRHCPLKNHLGATCQSCPYQTGYTLKMETGKEFKLKRKKLSTCTFYLTD